VWRHRRGYARQCLFKTDSLGEKIKSLAAMGEQKKQLFGIISKGFTAAEKF